MTSTSTATPAAQTWGASRARFLRVTKTTRASPSRPRSADSCSTPTARLNVGNCSRSQSMGATPPAAPQSSVRRLACGTVCTVVEYSSVKEIELYHFQPFVRRGRTRPRQQNQRPTNDCDLYSSGFTDNLESHTASYYPTMTPALRNHGL